MDPLKRLAQSKARETSYNLERFGYREVEASRGESAYVWEEPDKFGALVVEGLGTKNLVAEAMRPITGKTYHDQLSQDDIAMIVNDCLTVGALPMVVNAYFAAGSSGWFADEQRKEDLTSGFRDACNKAGAVYGGGESPVLKGIILDGTADLAGACVGEIKPKSRLILGDKLKAGDRIILIESSGIHANGLTLAREIEARLPNGYKTLLPSGRMYGEALLTPTHIYVKLIRDLFEAGVDIHYLVNVTGHGWRKLMRANRDFTYVIHALPQVPEELSLIQKVSGNDDREMYGNLNMGAGFAIYIPEADVDKVQQIGLENGLFTYDSGHIEEGSKQVVIESKNLIFKETDLQVR
ncbi:phosphoribosylformylglycinamidine cyclo-ligase [Candidatus Microgenomates bacterium]|nr:phosphoribosylformylglycinamidine cyclo-ligase [Candidatus Microgenomates bacterium]